MSCGQSRALDRQPARCCYPKMLISDDYRAQNVQMHEIAPHFGAHGWHWIGPILKAMRRTGSKSVLDYGAGKGSLAKWFPVEDGYSIKNYDPATFPEEPTGADFVVCLDTLEHIEPELLTPVLEHLGSKMRKGGFFTIATGPASKFLPDGRNAHLIVKPAEWWLTKLQMNFDTVEVVEAFPAPPYPLTVYIELWQ